MSGVKHVAALLKRSAWEERQRGIQLNCWMWMRPACAYLGAVLAHVGAVVGDLGVAVGNERDLHVFLQVLDRRVERSDRKLGTVGAKALQVVMDLDRQVGHGGPLFSSVLGARRRGRPHRQGALGREEHHRGGKQTQTTLHLHRLRRRPPQSVA